jgi:6-phosphogluconolactonase
MRPDCCEASFFPVDERRVPFDDPRSNWGAAYRSLLRRVGRSPDKGHYAQSAEAYEQVLRQSLEHWPPVFDVVFLGVGEDGHTASLFPGGKYLQDTTSVVLETTSPKPPVPRITLGPGVLMSARKLIGVVFGDKKGPIATALLQGDRSLPFVRIVAGHPAPHIYIERELLPESAE